MSVSKMLSAIGDQGIPTRPVTNLEKYLEEHNMLISDLRKKMGAPSNIYKTVRGERPAKSITINRIANVLGLTPEHVKNLLTPSGETVPNLNAVYEREQRERRAVAVVEPKQPLEIFFQSLPNGQAHLVVNLDTHVSMDIAFVVLNALRTIPE